MYNFGGSYFLKCPQSLQLKNNMLVELKRIVDSFGTFFFSCKSLGDKKMES